MPRKTRLIERFKQQRGTAKQRGIIWDMSFEDWLGIWQQSGHLSERGRGKGKYVMARFGDKGPYKIGNVHIITHSQNTSEGVKAYVKTPEHRANLSQAMRGRKLSDEHRQAIANYKKTPEHRAKLSKAMQGKQNAKGPHRRGIGQSSE